MAIMSKESAGSPSGWWVFIHELTQVGIYKRTQGRLTRQITCLVIWIAFALGAWRMFEVVTWNFARQAAMPLRYAVPSVLLAAGIWLGYRLVNYPPFADFLIAVEAEMNKVTWPSRTEMVRSAVVVIVIMLALTAVVFLYDNVLRLLLKLLNIVD
jgi:preprotein translocase subunit SecE